MKKLGLLVFCIAISALESIGQQSIEKNVGDFHVVKVFNKIKIRLLRGSENKVQITGSKKEDVSFKNKDGVLKITMGINNLWDTNDTEVLVYYTELSLLDANGGSSIQVDEEIAQQEIALRVQEGAMIRAALAVDHLKIKAVTGGIINVSGDTNAQEVTITTGGGYFARNLKTDSTTVRISAGGQAEIYARNFVKANTNAGGEIRIFGNPKETESKSVLGGKILEMN